MTEKNSLMNFLSDRKIEKGAIFTHTSVNTKHLYSGAYYIKREDIDEFYNLYLETINENKEIWLTEKHLEDKSPIIIDIDIKQDIKDRYKNFLKTVKDFIEFDIFEYFEEYLDEGYNKKYYILVRSTPYLIEKNKTKIQYKEGCHIIFPNIVTDYNFQFLMRIKLMSKLEKRLNEMDPNFKVENIEEIYDKCVIKNTNWSLLGSTKPNVTPYKVINSFEDIEILVRECSIRTDKNKLEYKKDKIKELESLYEEYRICEKNKINRKLKNEIIENQNIEIKANTINIKDNTELIELLDLIDYNRVEDYKEWFQIGAILYNISDENFEIWNEWSKQSPKYNDNNNKNKMIKLWNETYRDYTKEKATLASLYYYAERDNPEKYKEYKLKYKNDETVLREILEKGLSGYENDLAHSFYEVCKNKYVYCSGGYWGYNSPIWEYLNKDNTDLCESITKELIVAYDKLSEYNINQYNSYFKKDNIKEEDINKYKENSERCKKVIIPQLKNNSFKKRLIDESKEYFKNKNFIKNLDENIYVFAFNNGVYDLNTDNFREGNSNDYITIKTDLDYIENSDKKIREEIEEFINKILPDKDKRDYMMTLFAYCLNGSTSYEKFNILTGSGGNGKSKLIELFENCIGKYSGKLPVALLTQKRNSPDSASPSLYNMRGKRFCCLQETAEEDKINVSLMKELTGGDKIECRGLFRDPIEFKPQFTILLCCNELPKISSKDDGTWRRVRVIEFTSKFVENPNPKNINEYKLDSTIEKKIKSKEWCSEFILMILEYYKIYRENGIKEPDSVKISTKKYKQSQDTISLFIEENIEKGEETDFIKAIDIWECFKEWWIVNKEGVKMNLKRREFLEELKKNLEVEIIDHYQPYENNIKKNYTNIIFGFKIIKMYEENFINL